MELEFKNLTKKYKKNHAVSDISCVLSKGIYGLLGPNGSGKTTLIKMLLSLHTPTSGKIYFNGKDIHEMKDEYLSNLGYLPQYPKFYPNYTVIKFLEYIYVLKGLERGYCSERVNTVIAEVNLCEYKYYKIKNLSGGMRQRVGIAQALLNDPQILILDEPTAGLDPIERIRFRNLISRISKDNKM